MRFITGEQLRTKWSRVALAVWAGGSPGSALGIFTNGTTSIADWQHIGRSAFSPAVPPTSSLRQGYGLAGRPLASTSDLRLPRRSLCEGGSLFGIPHSAFASSAGRVCQQIPEVRPNPMAPWFWYAVVAAVLYGAHQIFTRLASEKNWRRPGRDLSWKASQRSASCVISRSFTSADAGNQKI